MNKVVIFLFVFLLFPILLFPQDNLSIEPSNHFGGQALCSDINNNYAYLCQGTYLTILDLQTAQFTQTGYLDLGSDAYDITVEGNYAYVYCDELIIVDISDLGEPVKTGSVPVNNNNSGSIVISNNTAFLASYSDGVIVVDVTDKSNPSIIDTYNGITGLADISVMNNTAYALSITLNKFISLNISDPLNITQLDDLNVSSPEKFSIDGNYAYIAEGSGSESINIINISNPSNLQQVTKFNLTDNSNKPLRGYTVTVNNGIAYAGCTGSSWIVIADVSNPSAPAELGKIQLSDGFGRPRSIDVSGNNLYMSLSFTAESFYKIDVSNPSLPSVADVLAQPTFAYWNYAYGNQLYISSVERLWIYDISDKNNPLLAASYPDYEMFTRIFVENDYLYGIKGGDLRILDVSNHSAINDVATYTPQSAGAFEFFAKGNFAYLLSGAGLPILEIVDISNKSNPVYSGEIDLDVNGRDIFVSGATPHVFIPYYSSENDQGVKIIDASNPSNPALISTTQTTGKPICIWVDGSAAFVGSNDGSDWLVEVFDITDPANPINIAEETGAGEIWDIQVVDGYVFAGVFGGTVYGMSWDPVTREIVIAAECHSESTLQLTVAEPSSSGQTAVYTAEGVGVNHLIKDYTATDGIVIQEIRIPTGGGGGDDCSLKGEVKPVPDAGVITPNQVDCECGTELVKFAQTPSEGWKFSHWEPAKEVTCPEQGSETVYAVFAPYLTLGGSENVFFCSTTENNQEEALSFSMTASVANDWVVSSITISGFGSGNDKDDITNVSLFNVGTQLDTDKTFSKDDGEITFGFFPITIPAGQSVFFSIDCSFKTFDDCPDSCLEYIISVVEHDAEPVNYKPGAVLGDADAMVTLGCVYNEDQNQCYSTIQSAADATTEGNTIKICPGTFHENIIERTNNVTYESYEGADKTIIRSADKQDRLFDIRGNNIVLDGLTIENSGTEHTREFGIHNLGEGLSVKNSIIQNNTNSGIWSGDTLTLENIIIRNNGEYGIESDRLKINGSGNEIYNNKSWGILAKDYLEINDNATCKVYKNGTSGGIIGGGILAKFGASLSNVTSENNYGPGIRIEGGKGALISGQIVYLNLFNTVKSNNNEETGLLLVADDNGPFILAKIEGSSNEFINNGRAGIWLDRGNISITGSGTEISGNKRWGININTGSLMVAEGAMSRIYNNGKQGEDGGGLRISYRLELPKNFKIDNNIGPGLVLTGGSHIVTLENIKIENNTGDGILTTNSGKDIFLKGDNNSISFNGGNGIYSKRINTINIEGDNCSIKSNKKWGIKTVDGSIFMKFVDISKNDSGGVYGGDEGKIVARYFSINENNNHGIVARGSATILRQGSVNSNKGAGIMLLDSAPILSQVEIKGNTLGGIAYRENIFGFPSFGKLNNVKDSQFWLIENSNIVDNESDGILFDYGPELTVTNTNFSGNTGFDINNTSDDGSINADANWSESESLNVSGDVSVTNPQTDPVSVVVSLEADTLYIPQGSTDTIDCYVDNWINGNDIVNVTVALDSTNWLTTPGELAVEIEENLGGLMPLGLTVPANTVLLSPAKVVVKAVSQANNDQSSSDTLYIKTYSSEISSIEIKPDTGRVRVGSSLSFRADVKDNEGFTVQTDDVLWSATGGTIDSAGVYTPGNSPGGYNISATINDTHIQAEADVFVLPYLDSISVHPDSNVIEQNESLQFIATGYDTLGEELEIFPGWRSTTGNITNDGLFTSSEDTGYYSIVIEDLISGVTGNAKVFIDVATSVEQEKVLPDKFTLAQNYPNPFNPTTTIEYHLKSGSKVNLEVYDVLGRKVRTLLNAFEPAGIHHVVFESRGLSTGIYFYKIYIAGINGEEFTSVKKLLLLK